MRVLAIEAACPPGSIALVHQHKSIAFEQLESVHRTTESFAVAIGSLLKVADWSPKDVELVATTHGPGSFTGLRIAVTAAKVFAYAVGAQAFGINTLEVIAEQAATQGEIETVMDAHREELFNARYLRTGTRLTEVGRTKIVKVSDWLCQQPEPSVTVSGPGLIRISAQLGENAKLAPSTVWLPRADTLGIMASDRVKRAAVTDPWALVPHYYRRSAAEEKADTRGRSS